MTYPLSPLGRKILLDRYALRDTERVTFTIGDTVLVIINKDSGQRETGTIVHIDGEQVTVAFGSEETAVVYNIDLIDKPLETTPEQVMTRVATAVAEIEFDKDFWRDEFLSIMDNWKFIPAGRILAAAGNLGQLTFYNCYVLPSPKDSRGGIFERLAQMAEIMSRGGGVGLTISSLRPKKAYVKGVNGRSSGAVSWGSLFSSVTGLIEQGGSRRGALMLILNDWHPDIMEFINAKREVGKITNANISVGISDALMRAVEHDDDWTLRFPDTSEADYDKEWDGDLQSWSDKGYKIKTYQTIRARDLWDAIVSSAWSSAEPGIWFTDKSNDTSNSWYYNKLVATNPCGEQPLPAWSVCNLGAINLAQFYDPKEQVQWEELSRVITTAVRFLDNIVDITPYFYPEHAVQQMLERRIGLNTMGLAELLIANGIRYGSDESLVFIDNLYEFIAKAAYTASINLAVERGPFPRFDAEQFLQSGYMRRVPEGLRREIAQRGIRNVTLLTQAPNGSIGTMVGTSTGIEPFFSFKWYRKSRLGVHEENMAIAQEWLDEHPGQGLPDYFVTAMQLSPHEHVAVQAAIQRWVDSAISKTVNVPSEYTVEQVGEVYQLMHKLGCKGGTVYRDQSRTDQVLYLPEGEECPECHGKTLIKESGCETCSACGYSLCTL